MNQRTLNSMNHHASTFCNAHALGESERQGQPRDSKVSTSGFANLNRGAALLALIAVVGSGCSGIHATKSISPLDFILPGLLHYAPPLPMNRNSALELAPVGPDLPLAQTQPRYSS